MGPKQVYSIRSNGTSRRAIHDSISAVLELLTISMKEKWAVRCNFYRSTPIKGSEAARGRSAGQRDVCLVRFPPVLTTNVFLVQCKEHHHVLECQDSMMTLLVDRMASYQPQRVGFHIEGIAYHVGDYVVRLGSIIAKPGDEKKGWMLEVEYLPTQHWATAKQPIQAFVDMLRDSISGTDVAFKSISANYEEYALPAEYSMSHSAVQYALLCSKL